MLFKQFLNVIIFLNFSAEFPTDINYEKTAAYLSVINSKDINFNPPHVLFMNNNFYKFRGRIMLWEALNNGPTNFEHRCNVVLTKKKITYPEMQCLYDLIPFPNSRPLYIDSNGHTYYYLPDGKTVITKYGDSRIAKYIAMYHPIIGDAIAICEITEKSLEEELEYVSKLMQARFDVMRFFNLAGIYSEFNKNRLQEDAYVKLTLEEPKGIIYNRMELQKIYLKLNYTHQLFFVYEAEKWLNALNNAKILRIYPKNSYLIYKDIKNHIFKIQTNPLAYGILEYEDYLNRRRIEKELNKKIVQFLIFNSYFEKTQYANYRLVENIVVKPIRITKDVFMSQFNYLDKLLNGENITKKETFLFLGVTSFIASLIWMYVNNG